MKTQRHWRILSILMALCIVLSTLSVGVFADGNTAGEGAIVLGESGGKAAAGEGSISPLSTSEITDLIAEIKARKPTAQQVIEYSNNYQSMAPEQLAFVMGSGSSSVNDGLHINVSALETAGESSAAVIGWEKAGYLSAGVIETTLKYTSAYATNIGFVMGALNKEKPGLFLRYDSNSWVLQGTSGGNAPKKVYTGIPNLEKNTEYVIEFGYFKGHIILAIDGTTYIDETITDPEMLKHIQPLGRLGIGKRYVVADIDVKDVKITGVGVTEEPGEFTRYFNDYEDSSYVPNWSKLDASVITDSTGNKLLEVKRTGDERGADLDSPSIKNGTLSLDFKMAKLVSGLAFGFRHNDTSSVFSEIGIDPNQWVPESSISGGTKLDIPYPIEGQWNNLHFNFEDSVVTVYLNKEYIGKFTFTNFTTNEGIFGLRVRSDSVLHIDNLLYTDEIVAPKDPSQYQLDFNDGVTGTWVDNPAQATIITEGINKYAKLSAMNGTTWNDDSVELKSGSYLVDIKPLDTNIGVLFADKNAITFNGTNWVLKSKIGSEVTLTVVGSGSVVPKPYAWNTFGMNFTEYSVTVYFNGVKMTGSLPSGETFGKGKFGIESNQDIYIDNILYSEQVVAIDKAVVTDRFYLEEYYESATVINWTGLENGAVVNGKLEGSISAGSEAVNNDIPALADGGVYQLLMETDNTQIGVRMGDVELYHNNGSWSYKVGSNEPRQFENTGEIVAREPFILRGKISNNALSLAVNNQLLGEIEIEPASLAEFAVTNKSAAVANVKIDALAVEELRIYRSDYTTLNWAGLLGNPTFASDGKAVVANMPGVALAVDNDSYVMGNQELIFDWKTNIAADASGGRYGVLLRADKEEDLAVTHDINGKWQLSIKGRVTAFPVSYSMNANETYSFRIRLVDQTVSLWITGTEGEVFIGTLTDPAMPTGGGKFGLKGWYGTKKITINNLKMIEIDSLPLFYLNAKTETITADGLAVTIDSEFPRIQAYELNGKTMDGQKEQLASIVVNGEELQPAVKGSKASGNRYEYILDFPSIQVEMKASYEVLANQVVRFEISEITESGTTKVRTIAINSKVYYGDTLTTGASYSTMASDGDWHGITDRMVDDLSVIDRSEKINSTIATFSGGGLAGAVENNSMNGGSRFSVDIQKRPLSAAVGVFLGQWTYRHAQSDATEALPWYEVVVAEDLNGDSIVDWQDGAVAYRETIYRAPFGAEDMRNNMMYIAYNFASQANDPFLNTLDTGKVLYNYTDGFGQMILHKGYQAEGHDDDIPSYSNVGIRQGGVEEMKYLISEGDKYNLNIGVHINATEYFLDANELYYQNLRNATTRPVGSDSLLGGWDWIDTSFYVDQTLDVLTGQLEKRLTGLHDITKNDDGTSLDFYYIDVYTGNNYNAYKMVEYINQLGIKAGTEFAGPMEPGVTFVHWGPDLGYPNTGNGSILARIIKNDTDIFIGNEMFKGQKIPGITTWGDSKPDIQQGITVFFNEVLPTKYMQHHGVMKYTEDKIDFADEVSSTRGSGKIILSKDGKEIASWKDTSIGASSTERHTSETTSLIPWIWDIKTNEELSLENGAKMYHWNPVGGSTTWQLTDKFAGVPTFNLYELTQQGRVLVGTITNNSGSVTINGAKNTPYVLYPNTSTAKDNPAAGNWGEGSIVKDFAFNSEKLNTAGGWATTDTGAVSIKSAAGRTGYPINNPSFATWNRYAEINATGGALTQELSGLKSGEDYTVSVWTETPAGRKSTLELEIGDKTYTNYVSGVDGTHISSFKYRNTKWQRNYIKFKVPAGITTGTLTLSGEAGSGLVLFDDVRISKHQTNVATPDYPQYVVYEDFENTYAGWGPMEYQSGPLRAHITSDSSNENDNNPIVTPADGKVGPVMTWVLDGDQALKLSENVAGRMIKTNETAVKLEPNTDYEVGFIYTQETDVTYEVIITSRAGAEIHRETLASSPSTWNKSGHATYSKLFNTGAASDVQIQLRLVTATEGKKGNNTTFILDNFYIRNMSPVTATYALTVANGTGAGSYEAGESVNISANSAPVGKVFDKWTTSGGGSFGSATNATTTFTMPANAVTITAVYKVAPATTYLLTVTDGTGAGSYEAGESVNISANSAPVGKVFDKWTTSGGGSFGSATNATTTFTMPANAVTITATYKTAPITATYALTVANGTGAGSYEAGESVNISANSAPVGKVFDKWTTSGGGSFGSATNATTTFTMPANAVTITAVYKVAPATTYLLTVTDGTGAGSYEAGEIVNITANEAPAGKVFDKWTTSSGGSFTDATNATTAFTMPANAVTITATYKTAPTTATYALTVANGTGAGSYEAGEIVNISANSAPAGKVFDKWTTSSGGSFADATNATTTFTMPANAVTITAVYKTAPTTATYALTVANGTGAGSYEAGEIVNITANEAPAGKVFDKWTTSSGGSFTDATNTTTTFTMPANAVTITASFKNKSIIEEPTYALTVVGGIGTGSYEAGTSVSIIANNAPTGQVFDKWATSDGGSFLDATKAITTFTMPASAVTITASFKNKSTTNIGGVVVVEGSRGRGEEGVTLGVTENVKDSEKVEVPYKQGETIVGKETMVGGKPTTTVISVAPKATAKDNPAVTGSKAGEETKYTLENFKKDLAFAQSSNNRATAVLIRGVNYSSVEKAVLDALYAEAKAQGITVTMRFDQMKGNVVISRTYVKLGANNESLDLLFDTDKAAKIKALFKKYFSNDLTVLCSEPTGGNTDMAIKLDENISTDDLTVYLYDEETNKYTKADSTNAVVDKNGYLHMTVPQGTIIISDGSLAKK